MGIRLTDLAAHDPRPELLLDEKQWARVQKVFRSRKLLEEESLRKLDHSPAGVEISAKVSEQLGLHYILQSPRKPLPPQPSVDGGPMAALNGVWIDPVLAAWAPYLEEQETQRDEDLKIFSFFVRCRGFSIR
jgi:hypothetical protein